MGEGQDPAEKLAVTEGQVRGAREGCREVTDCRGNSVAMAIGIGEDAKTPLAGGAGRKRPRCQEGSP